MDIKPDLTSQPPSSVIPSRISPHEKLTEFESKSEQDHRLPASPIKVQSVFTPHHQAMLAALRVVLDLPRTPIVIQEEER